MGQEQEQELATKSLEIEYLHRKSLCEMLIGGDDISIWHHYPWHIFFNVCIHSRYFPLHTDWRKSDSSVDDEPQGNWRWNSISKNVVTSSPSHPAPPGWPRELARACLQARLLVPHLFFFKVSTLLISISWHHICNFSFICFLFICLFVMYIRWY